ncbi:hypothetical protein RRG08_034677 [Elysia crispata]|uniref:Peptidase A2 domain-containing protein n=1 Tax=Elysia crispata TaxID=231223 RepID=A0AAE0Z0T9_9GAST|nr:hypothetical protein RRG08_034677 [Elysia crispata]
MVTVGIQDTPTTMVTVGIQDTPITMEIDTGSSVTLITKADFLKTLDTCDTLKTPSVILKGYGGNKIKCIGEKEMKIQIGEQEDVCIVRVVDADGPSLLGRDIMTKFSLPWKTIFKITRTEADIISQYPKLFEKGLGKLKDTQVSLHKVEQTDSIITLRSETPLPIPHLHSPITTDWTWMSGRFLRVIDRKKLPVAVTARIYNQTGRYVLHVTQGERGAGQQLGGGD